MFLDRSGIDYTYSDIEKDTNAYENFASTGSRTVPAIIIDDKFIGGFNDLVAYLSVNGGAN